MILGYGSVAFGVATVARPLVVAPSHASPRGSFMFTGSLLKRPLAGRKWHRP